MSATITPSTIGHANTPAQIAVQATAGALPVTVQMNFESPVSEWQVMVVGDEGMGVVDVFRDIAVHVPNDRDHKTLRVLRTSLAGTLGHWAGYPRSGAGHLRGTLRYGNDEVFRRFRASAVGGAPPEGIDVDDALAVLRLQHWIVDAGGAYLRGVSLRILFVSHYALPHLGGIEVVVDALARELATRGHSVVHVASAARGGAVRPGAERATRSCGSPR